MNKLKRQKIDREPAKRPEAERRPDEDDAEEAAEQAVERGLMRVPPD